MPARPGRLEFRPQADDAVILDVFRRVHKDSLDAHARRAMTASGLDAAAQEDLDNLRWMPSPREWWRLACTPGGDLVGLTAPCRNYHDPVIGYIAVVPEHRGHGYAYDSDGAGEGGEQPMSGTMKVYVIIPDNDRQKSVSRITVRTTPVSGAYLAGPQRDCAMIPADLSLKAAR